MQFSDWVRRWNHQQRGYRPYKDLSMEVMADLVAAQCRGRPLRILDVAAGLGVLSHSMKTRFPGAHLTGIDIDPVLLHIARETFGHEAVFLEGDLRQPDWADPLDPPYDVIMTASALHWLEPRHVERIYHDAYHLLAPGGLLLNSDHMRTALDVPLRPTFEEAIAIAQGRIKSNPGYETWERWWDALSKEALIKPLLVERARRFGDVEDVDQELPPKWHLDAMKQAGFRDAAIAFQWYHEAVVAAVR